jgi:RNA polymerase sigma factor (sigma-70 family)
MPTSQMSEVIQYLRRTALLPDGAGLTDGQLLSRFLERRDEDAFAALVKRHGPMVWGVCRRLLTSHHDAEDAFQATFLVLVRKAAKVFPRDKVANWLYGVAYMTAHRGRVAAAKARRREKQVAKMPETAVVEGDLWRDLQPLLDQELSRLPDAYREVIVLSDLEGKTRKEVARQLGLPEGTVASRLARARAMLAKRLARHGLAVSGGTLATVLTEKVASAGVPSSVVSSTIKAVTLVTAGQAAATGAISVKVAALTEGVLRAMFLTKLKMAAVIVLVFASCTGGAGLIYQTQAAQDTAGKEQQGRTIQRADEPASEKGDQTPELQRRIGELEKQIRSLTSEVKALQKKLNTSPPQLPSKTEVKVFAVRHGNAEEVAHALWELLPRSKQGNTRIAKTTDALIVVGSANDFTLIETIITQLEKLPRTQNTWPKAP